MPERRAVLVTFAGLAAAALVGSPACAESRGPRLAVTTVATGLAHPWGLAFLPDGRMLVSERPGRLRTVSPEGARPEPIEGLPEIAAHGQGGLLDVVLAPDFAESATIFLTFSEPGPGGAGTSVLRARLGDGRLEDAQVIFRQEPKVEGRNHFGSRIVFDRAGALFVVLGDRFQRERAQRPDEHIGKIVRIRPDGSVPEDNPFVGSATPRPEIWSLGHRNVQGAALHPETGALWTVEHGARGGDEVNVPRAGRNYGWPIITYGVDYSGEPIGEGTHKEGLEQPLHYWDPSIAPSGLAFYTGDRFPEWRGSLFVGSLKFQLLVRLELDGERVVREERLLPDLGARVRDVRQGQDGLLYLLTDAPDGAILRIEPAPDGAG